MDLKKALSNVNSSIGDTYDNSMNAVLDRLGLEHKRSTMEVVLPALGIFGAGIAVGAALGVLFAPKRGDEIRSDLRNQVGQLREKGTESYEQLKSQGAEALGQEQEETTGQTTAQAE